MPNPLKLLELNPYSGTLHIENLRNINRLYENMVEALYRQNNENAVNLSNSTNQNYQKNTNQSHYPSKLRFNYYKLFILVFQTSNNYEDNLSKAKNNSKTNNIFLVKKKPLEITKGMKIFNIYKDYSNQNKDKNKENGESKFNSNNIQLSQDEINNFYLNMQFGNHQYINAFNQNLIMPNIGIGQENNNLIGNINFNNSEYGGFQAGVNNINQVLLRNIYLNQFNHGQNYFPQQHQSQHQNYILEGQIQSQNQQYNNLNFTNNSINNINSKNFGKFTEVKNETNVTDNKLLNIEIKHENEGQRNNNINQSVVKLENGKKTKDNEKLINDNSNNFPRYSINEENSNQYLIISGIHNNEGHEIRDEDTMNLNNNNIVGEEMNNSHNTNHNYDGGSNYCGSENLENENEEEKYTTTKFFNSMSNFN